MYQFGIHSCPPHQRISEYPVCIVCPGDIGFLHAQNMFAFYMRSEWSRINSSRPSVNFENGVFAGQTGNIITIQNTLWVVVFEAGLAYHFLVAGCSDTTHSDSCSRCIFHND